MDLGKIWKDLDANMEMFNPYNVGRMAEHFKFTGYFGHQVRYRIVEGVLLFGMILGFKLVFTLWTFYTLLCLQINPYPNNPDPSGKM